MGRSRRSVTAGSSPLWKAAPDWDAKRQFGVGERLLPSHTWTLMIPALPLTRATHVTWTGVSSGAAIERLKEKLLLTNHESWYLRKFFLKGTHFWIDSEENFWAPSRTSQVDSNAFYSNFTFEQMAFLFCAPDRIAPTAPLMLISSF